MIQDNMEIKAKVLTGDRSFLHNWLGLGTRRLVRFKSSSDHCMESGVDWLYLLVLVTYLYGQNYDKYLDIVTIIDKSIISCYLSFFQKERKRKGEGELQTQIVSHFRRVGSTFRKH